MIAACGGGGSTTSTPQAATTAAATSAPAKVAATAAPQVIKITAVENGDKYFFDPDPSALQLKSGEITVHVVNPSTNMRAHTFEVKALTGDGDIVKSEQVQPGTEADIKFTIQDAGVYNFLCFQRGHADRGQKGTLTVAKS
jgi:uncharacterized cupredoxin-like copper-binding protein